jgi:hypothetical protein
MLSFRAQRSGAKNLALLFVGGKVQSEIPRFARNDSEGLTMTGGGLLRMTNNPYEG